MHPLLADALSRGPFRADSLPSGAPASSVRNAVRAGRIIRVLPGVYADAGRPPDLVKAAALYVTGRGALSHTTALERFGLPQLDRIVHVTVPAGVRLGGSDVVTVHIRRRFAVAPPQVIERDGLPLTNLEDSLVAAWPLGRDPWRTGGIFNMINGRRTTPPRLAAALARFPHLPDRTALRRLVDLLTAGCRSPLEIFGLHHVFRNLPGLSRQEPITIDRRTYYLDIFAKDARVAIELDGTTWHSSPDQRERDLRRDAALATRDILVVRYSYRRLVEQPLQVRHEVERTLDARRRR